MRSDRLSTRSTPTRRHRYLAKTPTIIPNTFWAGTSISALGIFQCSARLFIIGGKSKTFLSSGRLVTVLKRDMPSLHGSIWPPVRVDYCSTKFGQIFRHTGRSMWIITENGTGTCCVLREQLDTARYG